MQVQDLSRISLIHTGFLQGEEIYQVPKSPLQLSRDALPWGNGIARNSDPGRTGIASPGVGTKVNFPEKFEVGFMFCRLRGESKR